MKPNSRFDGLFNAFFAAIPAGNLEETTIYSMKIHKGHLVRHLGADLAAQKIDLETLQGYVAKRQTEDGLRGRKLSGATIKKELVTLRCLWNWAVANGMVEGPYPGRRVKYPKVSEKPPFQTWQEIEKQISRGGLTENEQAELWDSLFLSLREVSELLDFVKTTAAQPFIYPMVVMAAHTGARRSEIVRSMINDFQDETVIIHERKRVKGKRSTRRVPLSSRLKKSSQGMAENSPRRPVHVLPRPGGPFQDEENRHGTPHHPPGPRLPQADPCRLQMGQVERLARPSAFVYQQLCPEGNRPEDH